MDFLIAEQHTNKFLREMATHVGQRKILTDRQLEVTERIIQEIADRKARDASSASQSPAQTGITTEGVTVGIYRHDGDIYLVKPNRKGSHSYALKMVLAPPGTMRGSKPVTYILNYEEGAMKRLQPEERLGPDEVEPVIREFGRCIMCGHSLDAAGRGPRMMGDICAGKLGYYAVS